MHGLRLHYRDWLPASSDGQRQEIVLAHGLSSTSHIWDLVAPRLAERYRVVAVDQRGHGESDQPDDGYDFPSIVADLHGVLGAAHVRPPAVLVGHSWGGLGCGALRRRAPRRGGRAGAGRWRNRLAR